ncbi:Phenylethanolamine N-methyltransferase, partial [Eudyptes moseleyi]
AALREGYKGFDPRAYLQNNYLPPRADFSSEEFVVPWKLRCLAETFASGEIRGHTLIDVGSGPTIYQLLSACDHFEEIVATDYLAVNREELGRWARGEPGTFDWSPFIRHVCKIEGRGRQADPGDEKPTALGDPGRAPLQMLGGSPQDPSPTGVGMIPAGSQPHGCRDDPRRIPALRPRRRSADPYRIMSPRPCECWVDPCGVLSPCPCRYWVAPCRIPTPPPQSLRDDVRAALAGAGFALRDFRSYAMPPALRTDVDDVDGVFFAHAQK